MNWDKELISLFDDPLLDDVRPTPPPVTADDRLTESFEEINAWYKENGGAPAKDATDFQERLLYRRLQGLREDREKRLYLKSHDIYNLLNDE